MTAFKKNDSAASTQIVTLPDIPELRDPNFLDVLLAPAELDSRPKAAKVSNGRTHPFMDALVEVGARTKTANGADALNTTGSALLDAFSGLQSSSTPAELHLCLSDAWQEDPVMALRIIWNVRSICDGKGSKSTFYRCWGWLYRHHPRTALVNLAQLVEPVSEQPGRRRREKASATTTTTEDGSVNPDQIQDEDKKQKEAVPKPKFKSHGYWKDILNILVLALHDELDAEAPAFLNGVRPFWTLPKDDPERKRLAHDERTPKQVKILKANAKRAKEANRPVKQLQAEERYAALEHKLATPKFRALYIAVARLFADRLLKDVALMGDANKVRVGEKEKKFDLLFQISLAGKWAPSAGAAHDRLTNISTAIAFLVADGLPKAYLPAIVGKKEELDASTKAHVMRSFYQRWLLKELRQTLQLPEPLMSANRWAEIRYRRVASLAMSTNNHLFFQHDADRFKEYIRAVELGKKTISGATLMPHELLTKLIHGFDMAERTKLRRIAALGAAGEEVLGELREMQSRVIEAQWDALVDDLRQAGSLGDALAICDVSASMGYPYAYYPPNQTLPIMVAIAFSLLIASLAAEPFGGGFITFSHKPKFVKLDLKNDSLRTSFDKTCRANAGLNTDLRAVFMDLLLPMAKERGLRKEDMVKRLFIFSDMQYDQACSPEHESDSWETTYDAIARAYDEAGYEVPQIVFWNLENAGTFEVQADRKGVAMMSGSSPAMVNVFMGEMEPDEDEEKKSRTEAEEKEEFSPISIMEKALKRFDTLQVVD
ncbi:unnamed protein product [Tilletia controversa]|uniref:Uncharacterized protein n=3 Tax=Tilletia TaxID=13289 RepID=A0A8X7T0G8_9BASI|nr:hypothetical protein CF336_g278 [Tilletia laevis]KAE8202395.1 hypothetical protein CF328_g2239 [Tilletia controversa]KAE8265542.1 hypothetical protein A4X03_0g197 [Tilletia caries]KAE8206809.1 hypothetical protein CF335_g1593 [Tilletia laevis]KAE8255332.1 hypothetical protein A4X06_0g475 [Tilletia controversa]